MTDFQAKLIKKMIDSEDNNEFYELNERFAPNLEVLGYVEFRRWSQRLNGMILSCSDYFVTDKGRKDYEEWVKNG